MLFLELGHLKARQNTEWLRENPCIFNRRDIHYPMWWRLQLLISCLILGGCATGVDWLDRIGGQGGTDSATGLTKDEMVAGLRGALEEGVQHAVQNLGRPGGFFDNFQVRIPLPESFRPIEQALRGLGQGQLVDDFRMTLNRAAEKAVPQAAGVLADSIRQMRVTDALTILRGPNTAATDYFRRTSETSLYERFLPLVKEATVSTGVTAAYKRITERAGATITTAVLGREAVDLDAYITHKALDGLFLKIADQEKLIREKVRREEQQGGR